MEIPGFYYDKHRKKYFKIQSGISGQNLTKEVVKAKTALNTIDDYKRMDATIHLPQTLHKQEINCQTKYSLRDELIRSQFKSIDIQKKLNLEVIDFCGNPMKNIGVNSLIGYPESDLLFCVFTGDSGSIIYRLSVKDLFSDDFDLNESKQVINAYPIHNRVVDICYTNEPNLKALSTLVHHFPEPNTINTSFSLNVFTEFRHPLDPMRQVYEFSEPIFSATHFQDLNILGSEKHIYIFTPSSSGRMRKINLNERVTALRTNSDGRMFIAGTNKGQLASFDIRESYCAERKSSLQLNDKTVVYLQFLSDSNRVIASCHNNYLCLTDLRMFDKPVVQYLSHSNSCSKIGFSVDESVDVLCSSGDDNLVRFWSITSGKLLHMYCPQQEKELANPLTTSESISNVCYSHSWNCLNNQWKPLLFSMSANQLNVITNENSITL